MGIKRRKTPNMKQANKPLEGRTLLDTAILCGPFPGVRGQNWPRNHAGCGNDVAARKPTRSATEHQQLLGWKTNLIAATRPKNIGSSFFRISPSSNYTCASINLSFLLPIHLIRRVIPDTFVKCYKSTPGLLFLCTTTPPRPALLPFAERARSG